MDEVGGVFPPNMGPSGVRRAVVVGICWHYRELSDKVRSTIRESFQKLKAEVSPTSR